MRLNRLLVRPLRRLLIVWLIAAAVIGLATYSIFAYARHKVVQHQWGILEAIANDRGASIAGWISERRHEALRFVDNPSYAAAMGRLIEGKRPGAVWPFVRDDIEGLLRRPHYEAVALLAADGRPVRVFGKPTEALAHARALSFSPREIVSFHEIVVGTAPKREIRIVMLAPIGSGGRLFGTLAFVIQPYLEIGPALTTWPWPDSTAEVLVFRQRDEEILYLTPPRDAPEQVLVIQSDPALLAAQAARTVTGTVRLSGLDYLERESVAVARPIEGTPWHLLAKIERTELNALIRDLGLFAGSLSLLLIGVGGLLVYSRFYQLQAQHRSALLQTTVDKQRLARRFDYLIKYANDAIILADANGRIREVNDRAIDTYGYSRDELLGRPLTDLWAADEKASAERALDSLRERRSTLIEGASTRKNGERFFSESNLTRIEIGGDRFIQAIMRDVTERRKAEARIRQLNRLYMTLSRVNEAILHHDNEKELLAEVCDVAVTEGGFLAALAMKVSADGRHLELLTYRGPGEQQTREMLTPEVLEIARGATASTLAVRDHRSVRIDDFFSDPQTTVFRRLAARGVAGSAAALPVYAEGRPFGTLGVYAGTTHAFDDEVMSLLERMAGDVGYAIRNLRQARALADSEERLALVFRATRDCYWDIRLDLGTVYFSPTFRRRMGLPGELMKIDEAARFFEHRLRPDDLPAARDEVSAFLRGQRDRTLTDYRVTMADGKVHWVQIKGRVVRHSDAGAPLRMAGVLADVTEERQTEQRLQYWKKVFSDSREAIVVLNGRRRILSVNKAFTDITGYSAEEVRGKDVIFLSAEQRDRSDFRQAWDAGLVAGYWQGELRGRRKNGEVFSFWIAGSRIAHRPGGEDTVVVIASDLTESKAARERIRFLSQHDVLTGLPNRLLFRELLDQAINHAGRKGEQLAVLFLDIDRFKNVNDSLGHTVGDLLLKEFAQRLSKTIPPDETLSRQGGDDFIVLLSAKTDTDSIVRTTLDLLNAASRPFLIEGNEISLTASIGIAVYPIDGADSDTLIKNADTAMYYSKERGRNNFQFFFHDLNARARRRLSLATELRRTVERGEFELHYQPQIDIATGQLVGMESLIRWPRQGRLVAPAEFIPMAEDLGLIVPIGEWVMQAACLQRQQWGDPLAGVLLAVNISALQFRDRAAIERLGEFIHDRCTPRSIELELTESAAMHEAEESVKIFRSLKERGIHLALDDFGTGYSSLNYLRRFPIDRIKVDQSFIHNLPSESSNRTITEAIIGLSKGLGLTVLAEGVETEQELALLKASGCDQVQGFYIAPPLPGPELIAWWRQRCSAGH